jgi:hypothetical protein
MKKNIALICFMIIITSTFGQLTTTYNLNRSIDYLKTYNFDPCISQETILYAKRNMQINFISIESCNTNKNNLNGQLYFVVIVDDTLHKISYSDNFFYGLTNEDILKKYKRFSLSERQELESSNRKYNKVFYDKIREEKRIEIERLVNQEKEKKRIEDENLKIYLDQKKKDEIQNAQKDSIKTLNNELLILELEKQFNITNKNVALKRQNSIKYGGILITDYEINTNKYDVTSVSLSILNLSSKRIKYASFELQAYNPVGDPINLPKTVKGVGFVEKDDIGSWEFQNVWFDKTLESVKIKSVSIVYEDGTKKLINDVSNIIVSNPDEQIALINYKPTKNDIFGAVSLREYTEKTNKTYELLFIPINLDDQYKSNPYTIFPLKNIPLLITEIEDIISAKKSGLNKNTGFFETTDYCTMIYLNFDKEKTLITEENLNLLLIKLKTLI